MEADTVALRIPESTCIPPWAKLRILRSQAGFDVEVRDAGGYPLWEDAVPLVERNGVVWITGIPADLVQGRELSGVEFVERDSRSKVNRFVKVLLAVKEGAM